MSKAETLDSTTASEDPSTIGDVEPILFDLKAEIAILGHLISTPDEVEPETWARVENALLASHAKLDEVWSKAWAQWCVEGRAAEAALAAVKAEREGPGSVGDLAQAETHWRMLRACARVVLEDADARDVRARCDVELRRIAADYYEDANAAIRRLERGGSVEKGDDVFAPLDARRYTARERATELSAASPAGLRAKAAIYLGELDLMYSVTLETRDSLELLADSIARDARGVHVMPDEGQDVELIRLCDRLVEIHSAELRIHEEHENDDAAADAALKPWGTSGRRSKTSLPTWANRRLWLALWPWLGPRR
jgi:hypothetical protein